MAVSWAQYKLRRNIDVDGWVRTNDLRSVKDFEEKLKALGISCPGELAEIKVAIKKYNKTRKTTTTNEVAEAVQQASKSISANAASSKTAKKKSRVQKKKDDVKDQA